jgi:aspartyl-tRNA(Asn)/glutamyl-tRNA(Gln) amidotransferase subunit A
MTDLDAMTIASARQALRSGEMSCVELVAAVLQRLHNTDSLLRAYTYVDATGALAAARQADKRARDGAPVGLLHGIPVGIKDVFWTRNMPTQAGSAVLRGFRPREDAGTVRLLRQAGAIIIGKQTTHEFACGQNKPATRNAWNLEHYPGGSSAGAGVSVAVGSALGAVGTDAGGSVRKPAALNGVVGLKPSYGRISRHGVVPPSGSMDHVGIVTRTVEDAAIMLSALAGHQPGDDTTIDTAVQNYPAELNRTAAGTRIGLPGYFFSPANEPEITRLVATAMEVMEALGAQTVPVEIPSLEMSVPAGSTLLAIEAGTSHVNWLRTRPHDYTAETRRYMELGAMLPAACLAAATSGRASICKAVRRAFVSNQLDYLAGPTLPRTSMSLRQMVVSRDLPRFIRHTIVANLTGLPALTVPCGFTSAGLPTGLQLIGKPFDEAGLLALGYSYQTATDWIRRPPVVGEAMSGAAP